ncbi:MAG TPA: helix-turn-helix transcriptional regulator [Conexibacter sp.]|nr:helix-turn-helix transcriptional regulator [Conexibacter sp.]
MITNERQYRITKAQLKRFADDIAAHDARPPSAGVDPRLHQAMRDALASESDELLAQVEHYEQLRDGAITGRRLDSLRDLPTALIEARIAAKMTQRTLADRLGVAEQQVQRWEATAYAGVGLDRLQDIADALGSRIREDVTYSSAA